MLATNSLAYEVVGSIRQLKNMQVFYPCVAVDLHYYGAGFPLFLDVPPSAREDISRYLRAYENKYLRVDAEILATPKKGMDGVVVLKEVLEMGDDIRCEPHNQ